MVLSREQKLQLLRILRAARANEPTVLTRSRAEVYNLALSRNLIMLSGRRRGSVLNHLTEAGKQELGILERDVGELQPDYAIKAAVRRAAGYRGDLPGDLPRGIDLGSVE